MFHHFYFLQNRVKVFMEFMEQNRLDKVSVDADQSEQLIRLLDAVVIRLEGGTDYDLLALDEPRPAGSGSGQGSAVVGANQASKSSSATAGGQTADKQGSGDSDIKSGSVKEEEEDEEEEEEEEPKPFILGEE
jgi:hypothetical protein